jgi:hypothetical protein
MLLVTPTLEVAPTAAEVTTASILADAARLPVRLILLGVGVKGGMQWACMSEPSCSTQSRSSSESVLEINPERAWTLYGMVRALQHRYRNRASSPLRWIQNEGVNLLSGRPFAKFKGAAWNQWVEIDEDTVSRISMSVTDGMKPPLLWRDRCLRAIVRSSNAAKAVGDGVL